MITISGGVISRSKNTSVTFKLKCDKCGNISDTEVSTTVMLNVTEVITRKCDFCGHNQIIKMKLLPETKQ